MGRPGIIGKTGIDGEVGIIRGVLSLRQKPYGQSAGSLLPSRPVSNDASSARPLPGFGNLISVSPKARRASN